MEKTFASILGSLCLSLLCLGLGLNPDGSIKPDRPAAPNSTREIISKTVVVPRTGPLGRTKGFDVYEYTYTYENGLLVSQQVNRVG